MNEETLRVWQERFRIAWEAQDTDLFISLFTEDAQYQDTPFTEPFKASQFREFWDGLAREQSNNQMEFIESFLLPDGRAIAIWRCMTNTLRQGGQRVEGSGVMVLRFSSDGRCNELREWQHSRIAGTPLHRRTFAADRQPTRHPSTKDREDHSS